MPLYRRLPKRGFTNHFSKEFAVINLADLNESEIKDVSIESLKESGLLKTKLDRLKVLGTGTVERALTVKAHAISESAKKKIEKAGGTVQILGK